jgi:2,3-bisphosphoglycerate-independent phosphoglycerate mutase
LYELLRTGKRAGIPEAYIHFIGDGRDTSPKSASKKAHLVRQDVQFIVLYCVRGLDCYLKDLMAVMDKLQYGRLGSIVGRYYAMDRDKRWDRVQQAYDLYVAGKGQTVTDPYKVRRKGAGWRLRPLLFTPIIFL